MTGNSFITYGLCWMACLLSISKTVNGQANQLETSNDSLEEFLVENELTRMLITHHEVLAESALGDRDERIGKLQRTYARELFRQIEEEAWAKKVLAKAKFSLAAHPNRKSERLRLAVAHREVELFQRDYLRGAEVAEADVDRIIEEINLIQRGVKQQIDNLDRLTELKQTEIGDQSLLNQLRRQFRHGEYLLGWSYYFKSASSDQHSKPVLRDAESYFRSFLELDPHTNLTKFSAEQFGGQSRFQRMATAGLGAVMHDIGSNEQSAHCFRIAQENARLGSNAEPEIETVSRWEFAGYLRENRTQAAKMLEENPVLLRSNMLIGAILKRSDSADELVEKALAGLALMRDPDQLREAMTAFPGVFSQSAVIGPWISGYLSLDDFQKSAKEASLKRATGELSAAVEHLDPQMPAEIRAHCRFLLGSCLYLSKDYRGAGREFLQASKLLGSLEIIRPADQELAAESAYRALQSVRLISGDQEANVKHIAIWLDARFPASPFARLAYFDVDLERRDRLSAEDAFAYLNHLRETESSVLVRSAASKEISRRFSLSTEIPIARFRNYVKTIQADGQVSDDVRIQTNYYYLSKLLSQPNPSHFEKEIDDVLTNVKRLVEGATSPNQRTTQAAEFLYFQSRVLRKLQPESYRIADDYFQQIKGLNNSSPWTAAATLEIAKIFENAEAKVKSDDQVFRGMMIGVYEFLSELPQPTKSANEEIVSHKLAQLYVADDRLVEAEELVRGAKQNSLWLPIRANLAEKKKNLRRSASLWQELEEQSSVGTTIWLEARLKRILVLYQFDKPNATELLTRTIALNPHMPPTFATRFERLVDRWGIR